MIVGYGDRERMIVQLARHKRANDKIRPLEGLMYGRRLVDTPGDWLEIIDVEDPGILAAIPANGINGMEIVPVAGDSAAYLHPHLELAALSMRFKLFRAANIALAIGGML